ncbi:MAG: extracellular solute-binding protein [Gammaproteobacteria bacterium]|nr:MAG: extracellular solute-binding protein [Gammaproteobacteria bacterium]
MDWREALPYFYRKRAPMMLMGQFALAEMPESVREDTGFISFPVMDPTLPPAEDAPTDILVIPKFAQHPEAARDFLRFMAEPAQQAYLNQQYGTFSPLKAVPPPEDPVLAQGHAILAQADGLTQFFDRDAPEALAQGMQTLVRNFVREPDRLDQWLEAAEHLRRSLAAARR